ncbi:hypothetical protein A9Z64_03140 [Moraxella osloensis]|nr:hypothetical protein AXE82_10510 [Moraxella osloensis]OBX51208.1 hypothetical protein A9Z64_03140 [Moraxella osloensis]
MLNLQKTSQRLSGAYFSKLTVTVKPYIKNIRIFLFLTRLWLVVSQLLIGYCDDKANLLL